MRGWSLKWLSDGSGLCSHGDDVIHLPRAYVGLLFMEWPRYWEKYYLPPGGVGGKVVLDAGAGAGESAYFFFNHGARRVIAIEQDARSVEFLRENATRNKWDMEIIHSSFRAEFVRESRCDFMKVDVEGGEKEIIVLDKLPECFIETHDLLVSNITQALVKKFGLRVMKRVDRYGICMLTSFQKFRHADSSENLLDRRSV
jgi:ribosomal protein L11 methylase PrmA